MKKNTFSLLILISGILISGGIIGLADAQTTTSTEQTESSQQTQQQKNLINIHYPIAELGNCADKASCKTYCDSPDNTSACVNFAEQKNLFTKNEVVTAKKFIDTGSKGPGSCSGQAACEQYCGNSTHIEECTAFAEKNGMMSDQQLKDSKKVIAAIKSGLKPPVCAGPTKCNAYCSNPSHMEECMTFSIAAGIVPEEQKMQMQKTMNAFKQGIKPPACQPNPPDQSGQLSQPVQPNPSDQFGQDLQPCDQYCADSSHVEECVKFSVAIGNMTEEQGKNSIKNGNKGPSGCVGKDACNTFCNNPDNQETCFNFAKENGMISEEDLQRIQDGQPGQGGSMKPGKNQNNQGQINEQIQPWKDMCSNNTELACADDAGGFVIDAKIGADKQPVCPTGSTAKCGNYPQIHQQGQNQQNQNQQGQPGDQRQNGSNQGGQQGNQFQPGPGNINPGGQQMPQQAGPGGCKGPEECKTYCESHQEECKNFQPQQNQPGQPNQPVQMKPGQGGPNEGQGFNPGSGVNGNGGGKGGPGNNNGGGGQSGWSNGTGNGGGNGGPGGPGMGGSGGPNEGQGFNPGSGVNGNGPGPNQGGTNQPGQQPGQMQIEQQQPQPQPQPQQQPQLQQ